MRIGDKVIFRSQGEVKEGTILKIGKEELTLQGESGEEYSKKFWEVNKK